MSEQDTYAPGPKKSPMDRLDPVEEAALREAELFYADIFGPEREPLDDILAGLPEDF